MRKKKGKGGQTLNDGDDVTKSVGAHYLARCVDNVTHVNRIHMLGASLSEPREKRGETVKYGRRYFHLELLCGDSRCDLLAWEVFKVLRYFRC